MTRPCAHMACLLGGEEMYPWASAGAAENTVTPAVSKAVATTMIVLRITELLVLGVPLI
ncbi:hypothetical protein GCM10009677_37680 [Sphaerisporangium rubeum]